MVASNWVQFIIFFWSLLKCKVFHGILSLFSYTQKKLRFLWIFWQGSRECIRKYDLCRSYHSISSLLPVNIKKYIPTWISTVLKWQMREAVKLSMTSLYYCIICVQSKRIVAQVECNAIQECKSGKWARSVSIRLWSHHQPPNQTTKNQPTTKQPPPATSCITNIIPPGPIHKQPPPPSLWEIPPPPPCPPFVSFITITSETAKSAMSTWSIQAPFWLIRRVSTLLKFFVPNGYYQVYSWPYGQASWPLVITCLC